MQQAHSWAWFLNKIADICRSEVYEGFDLNKSNITFLLTVQVWVFFFFFMSLFKAMNISFYMAYQVWFIFHDIWKNTNHT